MLNTLFLSFYLSHMALLYPQQHKLTHLKALSLSHSMSGHTLLHCCSQDGSESLKHCHHRHRHRVCVQASCCCCSFLLLLLMMIPKCQSHFLSRRRQKILPPIKDPPCHREVYLPIAVAVSCR